MLSESSFILTTINILIFILQFFLQDPNCLYFGLFGLVSDRQDKKKEENRDLHFLSNKEETEKTNIYTSLFCLQFCVT